MTWVEPTRVRKGRPPSERLRIQHTIRGWIVSGQCQPGARLPSQVELQQLVQAGAATVHAALRRLADEGFIVTRQPVGTFVASDPPHLSRFALLCPGGPDRDREHRAAHRDALLHCAQHLRKRMQVALEPYFHLERGPNSPDYPRLMRDLTSHRLAGLILMLPMPALRGTPVFDDPGVPRVALFVPNAKYPMPGIAVDSLSLVEAAMDLCRQQGWGRSGVGVLCHAGIHTHLEEEAYVRTAQRLGLTCRPCWVQHPAVHFRGHTLPAMRLLRLMMANPNDRPDTIIIEDDNLVPEVTQAMVQLGLPVGESLHVIAHANFPRVTRSYVPALRIGFDMQHMLEMAVEALRRARVGEPVAPIAYLKPVTRSIVRSDELD